MASCADEIEQKYIVEKPKDLAMYDYLNDYAPLKEYVDRAKLPNFKVGAALDAAEFNKGEILSLVAKSNFDEIVAGNAMKMASVVDKRGNMDFGTVQAFVDAAEENGLTIFGHTLAWHSQQPTEWLTSLLKDKPDPDYKPSSGEPVVKLLGETDYEGVSSFPYYVMGYEPTMRDGNLVFVGSGDWIQAFVLDRVTMTTGKLKLKCRLRGTGIASIPAQVRWSWGQDPVSINIKCTEDWQEVEYDVEVPEDAEGEVLAVVMQPGGFTGEVEVDKIGLYTVEDGGSSAPIIEETKIGGVDYEGMTAFPYYVMGYEPTMRDNKLVFVGSGDWIQAFVLDRVTMTTGNLKLKCRLRGTGISSIPTQVRWSWGQDPVTVNIKCTEDWQEVEYDVVVPEDAEGEVLAAVMQPGGFTGEVEVDYIELYSVKETMGSAPTRNEDVSILKVDYAGVSAFPYYVMGYEPTMRDDKLVFVGSGDWIQAFVLDRATMTTGNMKLKCRLKGTGIASIPTQVRWSWGQDPVTVNIKCTEDWNEVEYDLVVPEDAEGEVLAVVMQPGGFTGEIEVDYVELIQVVSSEITPFIPLTPAEKKEILAEAMDKWINGMIKATNGKVKAWDLVNEAVSGGGNVGDGYYDLQTANGNDADFFWQDYLGNIDYVVIAEKAARKAYAEIEGTNPNDLKLFVNDYNLESTWDDLKKVKSYVKYWIPEWEKAGAKIDGIGSQMHVSYSENAEAQAWQENRIVEMFKIMASSGKLVRVSELDMCYKNANNEELEGELTYEQKQKLAEFYNFIVKAYMENVPAAQQYGITQWCITDAPAAKSWRHKTIGGLWSEDHNTRMPAYAGWAEGLQGKTYTSPVK